MDVVYLDFQKAFDKIPHKRLGYKLASHGIDGNVRKWIQNGCAEGNSVLS